MGNAKPISVTQLNQYVKGVFEDELVLHNIYVYGEIYEFTVSGQNTFVTLRDGECSLSCVRYGVTERYALGTKVLLGGTVTFYARGGRVSFVFRDIKPYGESVQYAAFLQLKEKLRSVGWFENRPPLPSFIKHAVIVTSASGAVIHDFLRVVGAARVVDVSLFPVKVQGDGAADEIAAAIDAVNDKLSADVLVVARGGGANVDLEPFNTETVAAAVHRSRIPVISAVGHETDYTLCDYCASCRAATPSVAGEIIVSQNAATLSRLSAAANRADRAGAAIFERSARRLYCAAVGNLSAVGRRVAVGRQRVEYCKRRATAAVQDKLAATYRTLDGVRLRTSVQADTLVEKARARISAAAVRLEANNPLKLLANGYARVSKDGADVTAAKQLQSGDEVRIRFGDGAVSATVNKTKI